MTRTGQRPRGAKRGKRGRGSQKGSAFEREICRTLSLWWTHGKRDDVFWRTAGSGGRGTVRARKGLKTEGMYGDIYAVGKTGRAFLKMFTVEIKRGYPGFRLEDGVFPERMTESRLDGKIRKTKHACELAQWIEQARSSSFDAGSNSWIIIYKANARDPIVIGEKMWLGDTVQYNIGTGARFYSQLGGFFEGHLRLSGMKENDVFDIFVCSLGGFLRCVTPEQVRKELLS